MISTNIKLISSGDSQKVQSFSCGHESLDKYIRENTYSDHIQGFGTTHILLEKDSEDEDIVGFYTLRNSSLVFKEDYKTLIGYPSLEIYQFAVREDRQCQGIGTLMIKDIIAQALEYKKKFAGIKFLVLCAIESSKEFYKKQGFVGINSTDYIPRENANKECYPMFLKLPEE